ncbi:MAG: DUF4397 domain-containing protein [Bacteroidota bacterium]
MSDVTFFCRRAALLLLLMLVAGAAYGQTFDFRGVHLITGVPKADIFFNNDPAASTVPFESASAIAKKLPEGTLNVKVSPTGTGLGGAILNRDIAGASNIEYTAIAYGTVAQPRMAVLERMRTQRAPDGMSLLRIFNASTIQTSFDVYVGSTDSAVFTSGLTPDGFSPFINVNANALPVIFTEAGKKTPVAKVIAPFVNGGIMTLIVTGTNAADLKVYVLSGEQPDAGPLVPLKGVTGGGLLPSVRVMHAWRQTTANGKKIQSLDLYIDGQPKTHDLHYRSASEKFGPFGADTVNVKFTPFNEGLEIYHQVVRLRNDSDFTVILTKLQDGAPTGMLLTSPATVPGNAADLLFVRVANAASFLPNARVKLYAPADATTPVMDTTVEFLGHNNFISIPRGAMKLDVYYPGQTSPSPVITAGSSGNFATSYLTFVLAGDDSTLTVDLLNESLPSQQVFDPANGVSYDLATASAMKLANAPNPFSGRTTIGFRMERAGHVTIGLFDRLGRRVRSVLDEQRDAGEQRVEFDGSDLPAGAYLYRLGVDGTAGATGRMLLVK